MSNSHEIRARLKSDQWTNEPFAILSAISNTCTSNPDLGREFVIRALERRDELAEEYRNIVDELAMQVGLYPYIWSPLGKLSLRSAILHAGHRADGVMEQYCYR